MMRFSSRIWSMIVALLLTLAAFDSSAAQADVPCSLKGVGSTAAAATVNLALNDIEKSFPEIRTNLDKGLSVTLEHRVEFSHDSKWSATCRIVYDLWDETWFTDLSGEGIATVQRATSKYFGDALKRCAAITITGKIATTMAGRTPAVEIETLLNPQTDEQQNRTRAWLAERGIGANSRAMVGRAVGAMIDLKQTREVRRSCIVSQGAGSSR